jgi:hypothetical protein
MIASHLLSIFVPMVFASVTAGYTWPNPKLDALENLRWDQNGIGDRGLGAFSFPCNQFAFDFGGSAGNRTNVADWLRTVSKISDFEFV